MDYKTVKVLQIKAMAETLTPHNGVYMLDNREWEELLSMLDQVQVNIEEVNKYIMESVKLGENAEGAGRFLYLLDKEDMLPEFFKQGILID